MNRSQKVLNIWTKEETYPDNLQIIIIGSDLVLTECELPVVWIIDRQSVLENIHTRKGFKIDHNTRAIVCEPIGEIYPISREAGKEVHRHRWHTRIRVKTHVQRDISEYG
jgi:hypothetical protein